jgi:hydroxymethylpyrimidine/phosphomethylpyrimidine kinase
MTPPVALTINGTDPTGCGGTEADLKTFAAHSVHGMCVVAAAGGASELYPLPQTVVACELSAALAHMTPAATKVGAVATAENASAVAARARAGNLPNLVLDPVLDAATGHRRGVIAAMMRLIPFASVITPNVEEASELVGWPVASMADMAGAAAQLAAHGARHVVITGGQLAGGDAVDALWTPGGVRFLRSPRVPTENDRGRGCTFSAAIAAALALGQPPTEAVMAAKEYVVHALLGSKDWKISYHGGPLDHFGFSGRSGAAEPVTMGQPRRTPHANAA